MNRAMAVRFSAVVATLSITGATREIVAQEPRVNVLRPAEVFTEPFTNIGGIRALPGGDLLVSDRVEKAVYRINFATGAYEVLGHNGQGPMEYDTPIDVFQSTGQTTMVLDMGNMRVARMGPDGAITNSYPLMDGSTFRMPGAGDGLGNLYYGNEGVVEVRTGPGESGTPPSTTAPLIRWNPETGVTDTVTSLAIPPRAPGRGAVRIEGSQISGLPVPRPFPVRDSWAVAADGWIGIARAEPYHVEWIGPDGASRTGPTVAYAPVPVRRRDREAWAESVSQQTATMSVMGGTGGGSQTFRMPAPDIDEVEFPDYYPAFPENAAFVSSAGDLWVRRNEAAGTEGTLFDVFDREGKRVRRYRLPEGRTLVGFAPGSLLAFTTDEDDLQWLERFAI